MPVDTSPGFIPNWARAMRFHFVAAWTTWASTGFSTVEMFISSELISSVFGRPATMASSDTASAPVNAAAEPPPGTGSFEANASSRSTTVKSA